MKLSVVERAIDALKYESADAVGDAESAEKTRKKFDDLLKLNNI